MVELAAVVLPLMMVLIGTADLGHDASQRRLLQDSTRHAAHLLATHPTMPDPESTSEHGVDPGWEPSCRPIGRPGRRTVSDVLCALERGAGAPRNDVRVAVGATSGGRSVVVCAMERRSSLSGFFADSFRGRVHVSRAVARLARGVPGPPPLAETALPGHRWPVGCGAVGVGN
ncbi:MAG: hypothetical protein R2698_09510 [Microthrixaceae bacterium]